MNRELNVFTLRMLRDQYHAEHLDTEAEALEAAISALEDTDSAYAEGWTAAESKYRAMMSDGDCINRQAAIDEIDEWIKAFRENGHKESAADACLIQDGIIQMPSAQPEHNPDDERKIADLHKIVNYLLSQQKTQWIPCSEPPKESGTYIVTAYDGIGKRVTFVKYQKTLKRWDLTGARSYWRILAYKPLPEPWRGEQ